MKKTVVLGASLKSSRYSYIAVQKLRAAGHEVLAVGRSRGTILDVEIKGEYPTKASDIDTITLYLRAELQSEFYDNILATHPTRIIFNPGTENPEFAKIAQSSGIETLDACTLVLLSINDY